MQRSQPFFSIVTVSYNSVNTIEDTIKSVLSQSFTDFEYIIIDGGSTDGTLDLIKKYQHKLAYWCSESDNGIYDAMNKGLAHTAGKYVAMLNSDDWYEPEILIKIFNAVSGLNANADIICGAVQFWRNGERDLLCQSTLNGLTRSMTVFHPTTFIKREAIIELGGFSLNFPLASDYDLILRLRFKGRHFIILNEIVANMRLAGVSEKKWIASLKDSSRVKLLYFSKAKVWIQFADMLLRDIAVRFLKRNGFGGLYRKYKNKKGDFARYVK